MTATPSTPDSFIPVYQPFLGPEEKENVMQCLDSTWISSKGKFIEQFESGFASYLGVRHALSVCNGTVAMHLALLSLGIGPGDEVIVPSFTYIASVNPVTYVGATPVFVDSLRETWQMDPEQVRKKITPRTKAIIAVHLYGLPCDMPALQAIARENGLFIVEDCAEATGSSIHGQKVGTFGDVSAFSFFGNKTLTTGEGGMVTTHSSALADRGMRMKGQGLAKHRMYWHDILGYNYRMTNICAAIGCAQLAKLPIILERKKTVASYYREAFAKTDIQFHDSHSPDYIHSFWMCSVQLPLQVNRDLVLSNLWKSGIETRPAFYPVHTMPIYSSKFHSLPVCEDISSRSLNLPSWPGLSESQLSRICETVKALVATPVAKS